MVIAADALYEDGVLKLQDPLPLEERTRVRITIETSEPIPASDDAAAEEFVGFIKNAPEGVSLAADHDR